MQCHSLMLLALGVTTATSALVHPGLLHSSEDFDRIKGFVDSGEEPWATGWDKLVARTEPDYEPNAVDIVCRGEGGDCEENYPILYRDIHAAYANAIYWKVTGDTAYADAAVRTLDDWSSTLKEVTGDSNAVLAAGLYGFQMANVVELMRDYDAWEGFDASVKMLVDIFYPVNTDFLIRHNDTPDDHYWANWDLCTLASIHAIGVVADDESLVEEAVDYFKSGHGNGAIENAIWELHTESGTGKVLGQNQEAGRDQGHAILAMGLLGTFAQQNFNQGNDLFAHLDNRILAAVEYAFKYNVGEDVPFTTYVNSVHGTHTEVSPDQRGAIRPIAELLYAHYAKVKGLDAGWTAEYRDLVLEEGGGAEGGGGDYGPNSGGYDHFGFGTILYRLE